ncbi:MAG: response regulator [Gammaproteobacteria bacterium]|nr:response regulator [Gammaproteobacteria bacterium]
MSFEDIPILAVDDAKFSSAIIAKALREGGFTNVRVSDDPLDALRSIEKRPPQILITDWMMPEMDGLELTRRVKQHDEENEHFTYVILLTGQDDVESMNEAFTAGVDDFLNKANLRDQLLPRVFAAQRMAERQNKLIRTNRLLRKHIRDQQTSLVDPVTGLGNQKFALARINDVAKEAQARGGAACLILVGINNLDVIQQQFSATVIKELMCGISAKIRGLVRPLDVIARPQANTFCVITLQEDIDNCTSKTFQRIFDSLYMQSFKTSEGFVPVFVGIAISAADAATGFPEPKAFMRTCYDALTRSFDTGVIEVSRYQD